MTAPSFEKDFAHHPVHYFTLLCILLTGLWGLFWFDYYRPLQLAIVISMGAAYISWGIVHHILHGDFHWRIVGEYFLVAVFAVLLFVSLVVRS